MILPLLMMMIAPNSSHKEELSFIYEIRVYAKTFSFGTLRMRPSKSNLVKGNCIFDENRWGM